MSLYKELRGVLHHGTVMHADFKDPALRGRGVVSDDGKHAVWVVATSPICVTCSPSVCA